MTKIIEAVRQLRGEAHPAVQVPDCDLALANVVDCDPWSVQVGDRVQAVFHPTERGVALVRFRPA